MELILSFDGRHYGTKGTKGIRDRSKGKILKRGEVVSREFVVCYITVLDVVILSGLMGLEVVDYFLICICEFEWFWHIG